MRQKKHYDPVAKGRAFTSLVLRVAVAGYIVYLAWKILSGMLAGGSPIPVWAVWLICGLFAAGAVGFCIYAFLIFLRNLRASEILPEPGDGINDAAEASEREEQDAISE